MVVCQPGTTEVAKSKDTIVCTENTSGVLNPASTSERLHVFASVWYYLSSRRQPLHKTIFSISILPGRAVWQGQVIKPEYQNNNETVK